MITVTELGAALAVGAGLGEDETQAVEATLQRDPSDVLSRLQVLGAYVRMKRRADIVRHLLFLVTTAPGLPTIGDSVARSESSLVDAWLQVAAASPDSDSLYNAHRFLTIARPDVAEELLQRALAASPNDLNWWVAGLDFFLDRAQRDGDVGAFEKAAEHAIRVLELAPSALQAVHLPKCLAALVGAGWDAEADRVAHDVGVIDPFMRSSVEHAVHVALGVVALRRGDVGQALERLVAAASSFDGALAQWGTPSFQLANELMIHGEKDAVVDYLRSVGTRWGAGRAGILRLVEQMDRGEIPVRIAFDDGRESLL